MNFSNLTLNVTNNNNNIDYLFEVLIRLDHVFRYLSVLIHLIYFAVFLFSKDLHKKHLIFVNHACLVSSIYCIITFFFIFGDTPNLGNQIINDIVCSIIEIGWIFSSYIRMYSILLIAIYRYFAVFNQGVYKKISSSYLHIFGLISVVWLISIALPLISKYIFQTKVSPFLCLDGFSTLFSNTLLYFIFNYFFMIIGPSFLIVYLYGMIIKRLKELGLRVNNHLVFKVFEKSQTSRIKVESKTVSEIKNVKKQQKFANQFILMCFSVIASSIVLSIFTLRNVIPNFVRVFYYWRPLFRIYILSAISIIPIIGLLYHPNRNFIFKKFDQFRKTTVEDNSLSIQ